MSALLEIPNQVFPTCVGVNRSPPCLSLRSSGVPHMRGGEPSLALCHITYRACVPHMRGGEPHIVGELERRLPCSPHAWG